MWASLVLAAAVVGQAPAETSSASETGAQEQVILRLVRQLDSPRLAERQKAEDELTKMGPPALEWLPTSTDRLSAEVQQRLERIRHAVQKQLIETYVEPTRVTLRGEAMPLSKILAAIQDQTGNRIQLRAPPAPNEPPLTVDFDKAPFWQALDDVARRAGLQVYPFGDQAELTLIPQPNGEVAQPNLTSCSGSFRFEVVSALAKRTFRIPQSGTLDLAIEVAWEPRLSPIALTQPIAAIQAVDERGKSIVVSEKRAELEVPVTPQAKAVQFQIPLKLPSRDVKSIGKLHGTINALLPSKVETFRFDRLTEANNVRKRVGSATVTLQQARKDDSIWQIRILVSYDQAHGALASHRSWMFSNEAYLQASDGETVPYDTFESIAQSENDFGVAYLFALEKPLDEYTFVYKTPGAILSAELNYEFSNIELP